MFWIQWNLLWMYSDTISINLSIYIAFDWKWKRSGTSQNSTFEHFPIFNHFLKILNMLGFQFNFLWKYFDISSIYENNFRDFLMKTREIEGVKVGQNILRMVIADFQSFLNTTKYALISTRFAVSIVWYLDYFLKKFNRIIMENKRDRRRESRPKYLTNGRCRFSTFEQFPIFNNF